MCQSRPSTYYHFQAPLGTTSLSLICSSALSLESLRSVRGLRASRHAPPPPVAQVASHGRRRRRELSAENPVREPCSCRRPRLGGRGAATGRVGDVPNKNLDRAPADGSDGSGSWLQRGSSLASKLRKAMLLKP